MFEQEEESKTMNTQAVTDYLVEWIREKVKQAGLDGVVLGLSGGIDSAVTAVLAKKAFPDQCMALILPCASELQDRIDSQALAEEFNIPYRVVVLDNVFNTFMTLAESYLRFDGPKGQLLRANVKSRLRMTTLYYSGQSRNYMVLGTSNKSEISVGYATKYGDSGVDIQVLGDLLKEEVYELAKALKIPEAIINKPPSGGLWPGQKDEDELGVTYEQLDGYLRTGEGEASAVKRIQELIKKSEHKRSLPPIAFIPGELRL